MNAGSSEPAPIELERLDVLRGDGQDVPAVRDVSLSIPAGQRVFLMGANGAGKTSLLLALVGAVPFHGTVRIGGTVVTKATLDDVRRHVGFVFADPRDQFFLDRVFDEVAFGPRERGLPETSIEHRVTRALGAVGLQDFRERAPDTLSLGEQRRLAVATMLAVEPDVLLLDEPTASLDPRARRQLLAVIAGLSATVVVATHDLDAAYELGGRAVVLDGGRVVRDGDARDVLVDEVFLEGAGLALPLAVAGARGRP
jgi:cobalt/nickel transport system ATP-binding protein